MTTITDAAAKPPEDLTNLPALGAFLAARLREHFPRETEQHRQVLALAEEAGEFVGAYRRAAGMARRTGGWDDVRDELADVAITAHVTAVVLGLDLTAALPDPPEHDEYVFPPLTGDAEQDRHRAALNIAAAAGWFADAYLLDPDDRLLLVSAMRGVGHAARRAAHVLAIDLDAAVRAKARVICSRGWRDEPAAASPDGGREWAAAMLDVADALTYMIETSPHDTARFQHAHHVLFGPAHNDGQDDDGQDDGVPRCRVCGCTDERACPGGCHWGPDPTMAGDLCSRCAPQEARR